MSPPGQNAQPLPTLAEELTESRLPARTIENALTDVRQTSSMVVLISVEWETTAQS
jgi:hypothetical protein